MVIGTVTAYADFKTLTAAMLGTGSEVQYLARDGIAVNTGITLVAFAQTGQLVLRTMQVTKPPTLATDFPKLKYVTDIQMV
jgi:hypothetical protein